MLLTFVLRYFSALTLRGFSSHLHYLYFTLRARIFNVMAYFTLAYWLYYSVCLHLQCPSMGSITVCIFTSTRYLYVILQSKTVIYFFSCYCHVSFYCCHLSHYYFSCVFFNCWVFLTHLFYILRVFYLSLSCTICIFQLLFLLAIPTLVWPTGVF